MDIILNKENIFKKVEMSVSVVARDLKDADGNSLYDSVRILERDKDFLNMFLDKAAGEFTNSLCDFIVCRKGDVVVLCLNDRTNHSLIQDIQVLSENFICQRISWEWMKIKASSYSDIFYNQSEDNLRLIKEKLYYKNYPTSMGDVEYGCSCRLVGNTSHCKKQLYVIGIYLYMIQNSIEQELFSMYKRRKESASIFTTNREVENQIQLYIRKYIKRVESRISAYIANPDNVIELDKIFNMRPDYIYVLDMPLNWDSSYAELLVDEISTYVVNASIYDYLKSNYPEEALVFSGNADAAWSNIKHYVSVRVGGLKKPLQPF